MKKILFLTHTLLAGGAEKALVNLVKQMDKSKYDITVMTIVNDGQYINDIKKIENVKYKYIFNSFFKKQREEKEYKRIGFYANLMNLIWKIYLFILKYVSNKMLYKLKIKEKYDVEIAFLEGKSAKIICNSNNPNSKKIAWIHTDLINFTKSSKSFVSKKEEVECYKKFDKIVCVSQGVKQQFIKKTGIDKNILVEPNLIDVNEIIIKSKEIVDDITKPENILICTVGRLVQEKGYDRLLKVHNKLISEGIKHNLWIIGEGDERKELEEYIEENNLQKTVQLIGYRNNPYKYLRLADIFVCSSRVEGLSTVVSEAIILEKPIVTTKCPGVSEMLGEDDTFALITKNNEQALYNALKTILTKEEIFNKYKENIKYKKDMFESNALIKDIENIIDN